MKLIVIRNTEAPSNANYVVGGRCNESLTNDGISQANKLKEELKKYDYDLIFSSPVNRAIETAKIVNYKNLEICLDERITERDTGDMTLKSRHLIDKAKWCDMEHERTDDNVETLLSIYNRTKIFIQELEKNFKDETVVIVTHNSVSRAIWMIKNESKISKERLYAYYQDSEDIIVYE